MVWVVAALAPILIALLLQAPAMLTDRPADYDESLHLDCARSILRSGLPIRRVGEGVLYLNHPPLYLYLLAGDQALLGEGAFTGRLLSVFCALAAMAACYGLSSQIGGGRRTPPWLPATVAACLLAVHPLFIRLAVSAHFEMSLATFVNASLLCFILAEKRHKRAWYVAASTFLGLALLVKALAALLLIAYVAYLFLRHRFAMFKRFELYAIISISLAMFSVWLLYGHLFAASAMRASLARWVSAGQLAHDPRTSQGLLAWLRSAATTGFGMGFTVLMLPALGHAAWRARRQPALALLAIYVALGFAASLWMGTKEIRHLLPLIAPAAVLIAAMADDWLISRVPHGSLARALALLALIVVLAWISPLRISAASRLAEPSTWFSDDFRQWLWGAADRNAALEAAGAWLEQRTPPDALLTTAVSGPVIGYYADRSYDLLYVRDYASTLAALERTQIFVADQQLILPATLPHLSQPEREAIARYVEERFVPVYAATVNGQQIRVYFRSGSAIVESLGG